MRTATQSRTVPQSPSGYSLRINAPAARAVAPPVPRRQVQTQPHASFLMHITVATERVTELRQLVVGACGSRLSFMRIEPVDHAARMKVWLCVPAAAVGQVMDAVMRRLPAAEFGRIRQA